MSVVFVRFGKCFSGRLLRMTDPDGVIFIAYVLMIILSVEFCKVHSYCVAVSSFCC